MLKGSIKKVWVMGYIKHFDGCPKDVTVHVGWVDVTLTPCQ